jgi:hypothetical protein
VRQRIDSISLNPDAVMKTTARILVLEKELGRARPASGGAPLRAVMEEYK